MAPIDPARPMAIRLFHRTRERFTVVLAELSSYEDLQKRVGNTLLTADERKSINPADIHFHREPPDYYTNARGRAGIKGSPPSPTWPCQDAQVEASLDTVSKMSRQRPLYAHMPHGIPPRGPIMAGPSARVSISGPRQQLPSSSSHPSMPGPPQQLSSSSSDPWMLAPSPQLFGIQSRHSRSVSVQLHTPTTGPSTPSDATRQPAGGTAGYSPIPLGDIGVVFGKDAPPPTAEKTDPYYPKGYPCQVIHSYENTRREQSMLIVKVGDKGRVSGVDRLHLGLAGILLTDATVGRSRSGYVPLECIKIGKRRKAGEFWALITVPTLVASKVNAAPSLEDSSVFAKTISLLFTRMYENRRALDLPFKNENLIGAPAKIQRLTAEILSGTTTARLLHIFKQSNFSIWDLLKAGTVVAKDTPDHGSGIYLIIYWEFEDDPKLAMVYVGKTVDFYSRWFDTSRGHLAKLVEAQEYPSRKILNHYKMAVKAKRRVMLPVCYMTDAEMRTAAEQAFTSMLKTYSQDAKRLSRIEVHSVDMDEQEELDREVAKQEKASDTSDQNADSGSSDWRKVLASNSQLIHLADGVFRETGWAEGTDNHAFGATLGANFKSPIFEHSNARAPLVKTVKGDTEEYRRCHAGTTVGSGKTVELRYAKDSVKGGPRFRIERFLLAADPHAPAAGTTFDIVFSRALNGVHPDRYLVSQEIGPRSDHALALSLSIRLEWNGKNGNRYAMVLRDPHTSAFAATGSYKTNSRFLKPVYSNEVDPAVGEVAGLVRWLTQQKATTDMKFDFGTALLYEVTFLHLDQCFAVAENANASDVLTAPFTRDLDTIGQDLIARGAASLLRLPGKKECDHCLIMGGHLNCKAVNGRQCTRCETLGLPCTFTPVDSLSMNQKISLKAALYPLRSSKEVIIQLQTSPVVGFS